MNYNTIFTTIGLAALVLVSGETKGQGRTEMTRFELKRMDSLEVASIIYGDQQKIKDDKRSADARKYSAQTKAKAKQARLMQKDADDAGRESRLARKSEQRAHKARKQANFQNDLALKASDKSDKNAQIINQNKLVENR